MNAPRLFIVIKAMRKRTFSLFLLLLLSALILSCRAERDPDGPSQPTDEGFAIHLPFVDLSPDGETQIPPSDQQGEQPPLTGEGFAIYLLRSDVPIKQDTELALLALPETPLISLTDFTSYDPKTHQFKLVPATARRLDDLELPGNYFVVTVDREPIYVGTIMAAYFSRSDDGVVILWPPMTGDEQTLQIQLGYPGPDFFEGVDPRADPKVIDALQQAGKVPNISSGRVRVGG